MHLIRLDHVLYGPFLQQVFAKLIVAVFKEGPQAAVAQLGDMMRPFGSNCVEQASQVGHGLKISAFSKLSP